MTPNWQSYVPQHVIEALLQQPRLSPIARAQRFEAVALFADVSGFTQISEALSKIGKAGTEELTTILNSYFGPMIQLIHRYGGIIGKFGGDAMTILFPYTLHNRATTARRALQCALEMQTSMHRYEAISTGTGQFSLAMKAGLALGPVLCTTVGDPPIRLEYIIAGSALDLCVEAEHHANQGEVVVHNDLLDYAGEVEVIDERAGFSCVAGIKPGARPKPLVQPKMIPPHVVTTLSRYLHPVIVQRLKAGQSGFINEHRKVTVLFVSFESFDYDHDPEVVVKLQHYLTAVIRIVHRYDGYLNKVDMGDKGSKYIVLFGAPVIHENDEERALRCALELSALPQCPIRIGINTGFVYCGQVGSEARQEYTVMGDTVNLSARLMQTAKIGQILVSGQTQRYAMEQFRWEQLGSIRVKGKTDPISVFTLHERRRRAAAGLHEPGYDLPLIGRKQALQQAQAKLEQAWQGQGQLVGITGEAGLGKSRLAAEIINLAATRNFAIYGGACQSYGTATRYLVWRDIWRSFFKLDPTRPPEEQTEYLESRLTAIDPQLLPRLPLLGAVLNLPLPDNEFTRTLDSELRRDLLQSLLLTCLRHQAGETPLLFVLEDCHWLDALSQELLEFIGRNLTDLPVFLLAIYRPPDRRQSPLRWARRLPHFSQIPLTEFSSAEAEQLIRLKVEQLFESDEETPAELVKQITAKAQGNPFYIEEMLNFIHDRGLNPKDTSALQSLDLPDSLHSLILSRIDQLAEAEKTTLKVASVIGRVFKASWLWGSYPALGQPEQVRQHLETLSRLDLTPLDKPEPEPEYLFKHITTQEVAYDSLAFTMRENLHEAVGEFIERTYAESLSQYVDVLAHHYGHSRNTAKQRLYFRQAGDAAKAAYANEAALDYYQRLLPLLPETEQIEVMCRVGEVRQLIGRWSEAEEIYRQALAQAVGDQKAQARCQRALGHLLSFSQSYQESLTWLKKAQAGFERLGESEGLILTLQHLSFVYVHQSDYVQALACAEQQWRLAGEIGDQVGLSAAIENIGLVYWYQGNYAQARTQLQLALDVATTSGYQRGMILAGNDLAGVYWEQGDYVQSVTHLQQALVVATEIGDLRGMGMIMSNAGEIYRQQGDYTGALACYEQGLYIVTKLGDQSIILNNLSNIASLYIAHERYKDAERLYKLAIALGRGLNIPRFLCEDLFRQADLYSRQHCYAEAQAVNREALDIATQFERKDIQFQASLLSVCLQVALGQIDRSAAVEKLMALLDNWPEDSEQAAIHYELWRLDNERAASHRTAADLYRDLYGRTPNIEYRRRYETLTGKTLPDPPTLPKLPEVVPRESINLDNLLAQVEALIEEGVEEERPAVA